MLEPTPPVIAADLVEYLVLVVPGRDAVAALGPELAGLAASSAVRLLDLVVVTLGGDERPELLDPAAIPGLDAVLAAVPGHGVLLSRHDIELVALALRPHECAVVLVAEDRWARPLAAAATALGGEVRAGERIARERVVAALERSMDIEEAR
jgi:hypothetical protein